MKRFHIHIRAEDMTQAKQFYAALFGEPTTEKHDYLKWQLEDPRLNLAVTKARPGNRGVEHVGIEAETSDELEDLYTRLAAANIASAAEPGANCCYAQSDKHWTKDPEGVIWEMFHSKGKSATYGEDHGPQGYDPQPAATPEIASACGISCCA